MNRRTFSLVGLLSLFSIKMLNADENPEWPVVKFDKDGNISNVDELMSHMPIMQREDYSIHGCAYLKRQMPVWVPEKEMLITIIDDNSNRFVNAYWGKLLFVEMMTLLNGMPRYHSCRLLACESSYKLNPHKTYIRVDTCV